MTGGYPLGFFQYLGIPTTIQLVMVFHAVCAVILFTLLLFFNRHHILAPLPAVFNYLFIIVAILMTVVIPFIINTLLLVNVDPPNDKQHFLKVSSGSKMKIRSLMHRRNLSEYVVHF